MRAFTDDIRDLLRSPAIKMRLLMTFYLDEGTYRFCDDVFDISDGVNVWIGAGALGASVDIKSGRDLSAEPITVVLDGNHMTQAGIDDPAKVLRQMMDYLLTQRRVDIAWGFAYPDSQAIQLIIPVAAMKINYPRLLDEKLSWTDPAQQPSAKLEIVLDSLAMRYTRATFRTRSDPDQREIDPTDAFYSFTADAINTERSLYWGKRAPTGTGGGPFSGGGSPNSVWGAIAFLSWQNRQIQ